MLHIFKDSSFDDIDIKRIFPDYYSWVVETLKIVKDSKETWILRKELYIDDFKNIITPIDLDNLHHINFCGFATAAALVGSQHEM